MKNRIICFLFFVLAIISFKFINVKAESISTSTEISVIGAQVRTTGKAGLRFVGEIGDLDTSNISKYGIIIAYGEAELDNDFVLGGVVNGKEVLNSEVSELTEKGQFYITLYNIPESAYSQDVTARAYVITNNDEVIYGAEKTTRSLEDVVVSAYLDGDTSDFVTNVFETMYPINYEDFIFEVNGDSATITGYMGSASKLVIPSTVLIDDKVYSVDTIGEYAFEYCGTLTNVIISNSVTSIGESAFENCNSLTSITIPSSVTSIGDYAFYNCSSLTNVYYNGTIEDWCNIAFNTSVSNPMNYAEHFYMLDENNEYQEVTEIIIPNTITSIGDNQFFCFNNITSIEIPSSVTSIGDSSFNRCNSLKSIEIPSSVTSIGNYAFYGCAEITSISISENVTNIGFGAFGGCNSLESIVVDNNNPTYDSRNNSHCIIETSTNTLLATCKNTIIPDSVVRIGASAYEGCSEISNIIISNNIIEIGDYAFCGCTSLTSIIIPESVTSIGYYAFALCSSMTNIEIPSSVTSIGAGAFSYCSSLTNVYYNGTIEDWCNIIFMDIYSNPMYYASHIFMLDENNEYQEVTEIIIPNTITSIGNNQFCGFNITSIEISSSVTNIGSYAFYNCSSLTSITLPFIGEKADGSGNNHFGYIFGASSYSYNYLYIPTSLKEVIITGGESIGKYAFYHCSSITNIEIPSSVTSIVFYAFYNCSSLTNIYYRGTLEEWNNIIKIGIYSNPMEYAKHLYVLDVNGNYVEVDLS